MQLGRAIVRTDPRKALNALPELQHDMQIHDSGAINITNPDKLDATAAATVAMATAAPQALRDSRQPRSNDALRRHTPRLRGSRYGPGGCVPVATRACAVRA